MSYIVAKQDIEYIREISDKALDFMSEYNVIPTPANYQIWYNYASEEDLILKKTIDTMIEKGKSFSSEVCKNIYEKFFSNDKEQHVVSKTGTGIQSELDKIAKTISEINQDTTQYGEALGESLQGIDKIPGGDAVKTIITSLMKETKQMADSNQAAQKQLKDSAQTVQKLQSALDSVRQESLTDLLTNIGNRKMFEENLHSAMKKVNQDNSNLNLVIGDIDHFKKFNDTWGHHVGDQVLKAVAHTIKTRIGDNGITARYGGEEFVIIVPDMTIEQAEELSNTVRKSISQRSMKRKSTGESIGKITCSFGIAQYRPNEHRNDFLERADSALYHSKKMGRNKVSLESEIEDNVVKIA